MKLVHTLTLLVASLFTNCQEEVQSSEIEKISFGTSFGMCVGYCTQVVTFTDGEVSKTLTPRVSEDLEVRTCTKVFHSFNSLTSRVDLNAFRNLAETIGCPGCADGGAEWIEITFSGSTKRVTYEFEKEPDAVKSFIDELRKQYDSLAECE